MQDRLDSRFDRDEAEVLGDDALYPRPREPIDDLADDETPPQFHPAHPRVRASRKTITRSRVRRGPIAASPSSRWS